MIRPISPPKESELWNSPSKIQRCMLFTASGIWPLKRVLRQEKILIGVNFDVCLLCVWSSSCLKYLSLHVTDRCHSSGLPFCTIHLRSVRHTENRCAIVGACKPGLWSDPSYSGGSVIQEPLGKNIAAIRSSSHRGRGLRFVTMVLPFRLLGGLGFTTVDASGCWNKWRSMSPSATPATQDGRRCHQLPRLPHKLYVANPDSHSGSTFWILLGFVGGGGG